MMRRNSSTLFLVVLLAGLLFGVSPVHAHDTLISVTPEDGSEVEVAPDQAVLTFSGQPLDIAPQAVLQKDGQVVDTGDVSLDGYDLILPLPELDAGDYTIIFSIVSSDGHRIDGSTGFSVSGGTTVEEPTESEPTPDSSEEPEPAVEDTADTDSGDRAETDTDESSGAATWIRWGGILIVVLGGAVLISRFRRNQAS